MPMGPGPGYGQRGDPQGAPWLCDFSLGQGSASLQLLCLPLALSEPIRLQSLVTGEHEVGSTQGRDASLTTLTLHCALE